MQKMGGLAFLFPFTCAMMLIGNLSLIGFQHFLLSSVSLSLHSLHVAVRMSPEFLFLLYSFLVLFCSFLEFQPLLLSFLKCSH
ncbi:unnamed protein product [Coffea canephora]|uniref:Uncharacterized protein n=1 Tax=Coffea canephora TaxID=49390 RepID=A0A068U8H2_COFCA|nr:unnamed protein product [Coffea canephora]